MSYIKVHWLGQKSYSETWEMQKEIVQKISEDSADESVLLVEHYPVVTLGRTGNIGNLLLSESYLKLKGIDFFRIERGGDITYHGLGQLVGYPMLRLKRLNLSLSEYIRVLEQVIIDLLALYNIKGYREPKYTGVWCSTGKLCAIGIAARKYITYHGFALNVNTDVSEFSVINPCGITDKPVASMHTVLGRTLDLTEVAANLTPILVNRFG